MEMTEVEKVQHHMAELLPAAHVPENEENKEYSTKYATVETKLFHVAVNTRQKATQTQRRYCYTDDK